MEAKKKKLKNNNKEKELNCTELNATENIILLIIIKLLLFLVKKKNNKISCFISMQLQRQHKISKIIISLHKKKKVKYQKNNFFF